MNLYIVVISLYLVVSRKTLKINQPPLREIESLFTANVKLCHVTKFSLYLSLTVLYFSKKNKRFHGIFIHENCFRLFLNAHFLFWEILHWSLPFSVNVTLRVRSFGMIRIWISYPRSLRSLWIKWTDESLFRVDSSFRLIYHDPSDLRSLILADHR